jgi:hypothetical protein
MEVTPREVSKTCCDGGSCKVGRYVYVDHKKNSSLTQPQNKQKLKPFFRLLYQWEMKVLA